MHFAPILPRILYLEDNRVAQVIMRRILGSMCRLEVSDSLKAGQTLITAQAWDLLITDFIFPEGNTLDFIAQVRRTHSAELLPIIGISGSMDRNMAGSLRQVGANAAIGKNTPPDTLRELVKRMLHQPTLEITSTSQTAECVSWQEGDQVVLFCPGTGTKVLAETERAAVAQMRDILRLHRIPYAATKAVSVVV